jgi:hypothetical protein
MNRAEYYRRRHDARRAIRARGQLPREPYATWQDRERAQDWVRTCVGRLPGHAYARPYGFIDRQTRLVICAEFPQWIVRRNQLWHRRQHEATQRRIQEFVAHLGPSVLEQNIAAERARKAAREAAA